MNRRDCLGTMLGAAVAVFGTASADQSLPKRKRVRVAFLLGDSANVIDTAGPWEVFQDTMLDGMLMDSHPFELYTVAPTDAMLRMTGGLQVVPHYDVTNAPEPNVIVVPAHKSTEASRAWLKRASADTDVTMSVCTGAFQLARAGLLTGLPATTHHEFWDDFAQEFPDVELKPRAALCRQRADRHGRRSDLGDRPGAARRRALLRRRGRGDDGALHGACERRLARGCCRDGVQDDGRDAIAGPFGRGGDCYNPAPHGRHPPSRCAQRRAAPGRERAARADARARGRGQRQDARARRIGSPGWCRWRTCHRTASSP